MSGDCPRGTSRGQERRGRIFSLAIAGAVRDKHELPQPNYYADLQETEAWRNQKGSFGGPKRSGNVADRRHSGTYRFPSKYEGDPRYNYRRANSYGGSVQRSEISRNRYNYIVSDDHSSGNSTIKNPDFSRTMCSSSFSNSAVSPDKYSCISEEKQKHNILKNPVPLNLASQNIQTVSTVDSSFLSGSLKSSDRTIPSQLHSGSEQSLEFKPSSTCYSLCTEVSGIPESFGSSRFYNTLSGGGFIPPPTPPSNPSCDHLLDSTVLFNNNNGSHVQQNESITVFLPVSSNGDLCGERKVMLKSPTVNSKSSCDLIQPDILSVKEQNCQTESKLSNVNICDTSSEEDINDDECEEECLSIVDVTPEQIEAVSKLLIEVEKDRTPAESDQVTNVVETLTRIVKKCIRGCWLEAFGSYVSGFAIGTSDINIALIPDKHIASSHKILQEMVKPILRDIPDCEPVYEGDHDYRSAFVSFFEPKSNICCKVRILGNNLVCKTAKLLHRFEELDSRVRTLVIAVRHWAEVCEIHEAENGRLHPLNFVLMMVHFLQQHHPPVLPIANVKAPWEMNALDENKQSVGELWLEFFKYYAETFNWKDNVVSIVNKDPVLKSSKPYAKCWIAVEEPYDDVLVNVAKSVVSQDVSNFIRMCIFNTYKYFLHPTSSEALEASSDQTEESLNSGVWTDSNENLCEFHYDFFQDNFLNGLCVPVVCSACEHLGHLCDDCLHEENGILHTLPKMTPEFLHVIDEALQRIYECCSISETHLKSREDVIEKLEKHLRKQLKYSRIELIGSSKNGFGLRDSDVDICFTLEGQSIENVDAKYMVKKIKNILLKNREFSDIMYISTSKIPIVKFIDRRTKLRCDISIYNELAVYNTRLLRAYSMIDTRVRILGCAMKKLAKNACIDDTVQRTLSSYSYVLMVLYFLQQTEPPVIPVLQELYDHSGQIPEHIVENQNVWFFEDIENLSNVWDGKGKNQQTVGELWVGLLDFYTTKFDYHHFISISQKSLLVELKNVPSAMLFNIQDPFIKDLNLGARMSGSMSRRTLRTLQRARVLFGMPIPTDKPPSGFQSFEEYLFNPMNLTDGRVMGKKECSLCGKLGHTEDSCKRYKFNATPFWSKVPKKTYRRLV